MCLISSVSQYSVFCVFLLLNLYITRAKHLLEGVATTRGPGMQHLRPPGVQRWSCRSISVHLAKLASRWRCGCLAIGWGRKKKKRRETCQTHSSWHSSKVKNSRQGRLASGCTTILSTSLLFFHTLSSLLFLLLLPLWRQSSAVHPMSGSTQELSSLNW